MKRKTAIWILILVVASGVALRSWHLTARSLWFDEAFSWRLVEFPFSEMIARAATDVHPPLYYVILRGWTEIFGTSLVGLRSFSVTLAGATLLAAYLFTTTATGRRSVGVVAAALLAASGWQAAFAWEARMYTLGTFLALISSWLLLKAVRRQNLYLWALYSIVAAAFAYTHYFAFFTLFAHGLFVLAALIMRTRWRVGEMLQSPLLWSALGAAILVIGFYLPWIPTFITQNSQVQQSYWVPPIGGWSIPDTFYRMYVPTSGIPSHAGIGIFLTSLPIIFTIIGWGIVLAGRHARDAKWFVVILGFVPFLLAIAISFVGQSLYQDRFLVFANIFIFIALAMLLAQLPRRWYPWASAVTILLLLTTYWGFWQELDIENKPGAHAATTYAFQVHDEGPVVVTSPFIYFAVIHYLQEEYGNTTEAKLYSETGQLAHFEGGPILTDQDIIGPSVFDQPNIQNMTLVETSGFGGTKLPLPINWRVIEEKTFPEVFTYQGEVFVRKIQR
ncbi:MAG: glycosyltransferase family 39 protein [Candidatus Andersenbacteria bacterium]|nr:glycosyltransferase family 39 protein [Candidatus Andersenbacteria bacterium]MBI3250348.1 glycosyltransferase family 39 protein [Candidatus Andersenbacteria bacterium]